MSNKILDITAFLCENSHVNLTLFGANMPLSIEQLNNELLKLAQIHNMKPKDMARIQELKSLGANINFANMAGNTPLYFAVQKGDPKCVAKLLELGANTNTINRDGDTPLHIMKDAYSYNNSGHEECFKLLIEHKANPLSKNNKGFTPLEALEHSLTSGRVDKKQEELKKIAAFKKLLSDGTVKWLESQKGDDAGYYVDSIKFNWFWNPMTKLGVAGDSNKELMEDLERAIRCNDVRAVRALEQSGLDLTDPALLKQVFVMGKNEIMKCLLEAGANPNITIEHKDKGEISLLYYSIVEKDQKAFEVLIHTPNIDVNMQQPGQDHKTAIQCMHSEGVDMLSQNHFVRAIVLHKGAELDIPNKKEVLDSMVSSALKNAKFYVLSEQSGSIDLFYYTLNVLDKLDKDELIKLSTDINNHIIRSISSTYSRLLKDKVVQEIWGVVKDLDWPKDSDMKPIYDSIKKATKDSIMSYGNLKSAITGLARCKQVEKICEEMKSSINLNMQRLDLEDSNQQVDLSVQSPDHIEEGNLVEETKPEAE